MESVHLEAGEIVKRVVIIENDDKGQDGEGILAAKDVDASGLRGIRRPLWEKCFSTGVEDHAEILAVVTMAERSLVLERHVTKPEQVLVEVEQKLQVASSAALAAQHRAQAKAKKARKCCEELEYDEERAEVAQVAEKRRAMILR